MEGSSESHLHREVGIKGIDEHDCQVGSPTIKDLVGDNVWKNICLEIR